MSLSDFQVISKLGNNDAFTDSLQGMGPTVASTKSRDWKMGKNTHSRKSKCSIYRRERKKMLLTKSEF